MHRISTVELVTCECGYPRAVGFACTACIRFDHLPSYHTTVTGYGAAVDSLTDADVRAALAWEDDGGAPSPYRNQAIANADADAGVA